MRQYVSQDSRLVATWCTLELRLSVRLLNANLHGVPQRAVNLSNFSISCQSQSMFLTSRFRSRRAADTSPLRDPKRHPRRSSGDMAAYSLQAFVHFPLSKVFRPHVNGIFDSRHFHDGQLTVVPLPLAPTRLGYGDVSLAPLRALKQSPSTLWRPLVHVVSPPLTCQQPWPLRPELSTHSWSTRKTPLRLSSSPPHFELLPTKQGDGPPSIMHEDEVDRRVSPCPVAV